MILFVFILVFAFILNVFLPWWSIALPGLIGAYQFKVKPGMAFVWGFLAVFVAWGGHAIYLHLQNDGILSQRIADMLSVGSPWVVILATALVGGLVSGLAALTGSLLNSGEEKS